MATYYPSSANQRDIIPALYLKDSGHVPINESVLQGNMLYLNYSQFGSYPENMAGSPNPQQSNVGLAIPGNILLQGSSLEAPDLLNSRMADPQYGSWREGERNEQSFIQMQDPGRSISGSNELIRHSGADNPTMNLGSELGILNGHSMPIQQTNLGGTTQGQGLSLTLGTQIPGSFHYRPDSSNMPLVGAQQPISGNMVPGVEESSGNDKQTHIYPSSHGLSSLVSSLPNSRYLKAAQQLLDEVVNVRKALKSKLDKSQGPRSGANGKESDEGSKSDGTPAKPQESNPNSTSELSPAERQDLQNKLTKLLAMLDEVDRRYKQYYHQMQIVVSSFDVIAGNGAAKPYTALALQTISRHFRCLRDAISNQIRITRESLGEQDGSSKGGGLSRLRYIDQQLRQQRAFQQFGMMQHHAWRPQRGLPENSVSILRAWLFEHFLHPYPKDSDKIMLSRQTGLTRNQVSNWFINARVRLWKPMIEEMYKEEIGDAEIDSRSSSENLPRGKDLVQSPEDQDELQSMKEGMEKPLSNHLHGCLDSPNYQGTVHSEHTNYIGSDRRAQHLSSDDGGLLQQTLMQASGSSERFMTFQMSNLERYIGSGPAGVSLTLGLQHCDGGLPDGQRGMVALRGDGMLNGVSSLGADAADYSCINLPDSRQGFNSSHLLHDFVA